jgi:ubiquinone/menaquinone biosynthesis C-methylase UbiE
MSLRQRVIRTVVGQFGRPHGVGGHLAGWVMAHRSSNRERNRWVVSLLNVQPTDRVLEIGFGPGLAIETMSRLATCGKVYGIDHSAVMVRRASRRNRAAIRAGRVDLRLASADNLPAFDRPLDVVLAVNSMGFWSDSAACLKELRRRLRPGGQIAVASQPRCPGATSETSRQAAREIEVALTAAGFTPARVETLPLVPPVVCVLAISGSSHDNEADAPPAGFGGGRR